MKALFGIDSIFTARQSINLRNLSPVKAIIIPISLGIGPVSTLSSSSEFETKTKNRCCVLVHKNKNLDCRLKAFFDTYFNSNQSTYTIQANSNLSLVQFRLEYDQSTRCHLVVEPKQKQKGTVLSVII